MRFGAVPLAQAQGAVLAHSVPVTAGRLRKGRVLAQADIAALQEAGITEVIVARLDDGDVGEDAAAQALANALVPDPAAAQLDVTKPFTGRVNLLARGPGVAVLDAGAVQAVNRIHPMITVATVPPMQQMAGGGMVATIKIISYAVPGAALKTACAAARAAIRLAPPVLRSASLIVTEIPGGAGDKGRAAIEARTDALGLTMEQVTLVAHRTDALAAALRSAASDLTLILTGSATSDIDDVAPSALRAAGGRVERFGMPVDPGNLLFLGDLGGRAVIGLPGCARSPALNGADWVLARVACGIAVTGDDIAAMGVGGLLKEIPTRPQPRRKRPAP
ncbi:molybdopterin-binding protein [Sulfitobacter sabulilitoris]|uniref:Molybdopterin biosynthesis protein n=1 Tax=Sulfitobacter sabulilitoris TaxID=2562655 RepID=A0A5S3PIY9_9RHOB|nr:molybdopterin-binding protein [Sulfitobacter sabulilitoris]TMM54358.1 molybdopterin biosynthesis protein [Sulfitobacter sabulilitoris]